MLIVENEVHIVVNQRPEIELGMGELVPYHRHTDCACVIQHFRIYNLSHLGVNLAALLENLSPVWSLLCKEAVAADSIFAECLVASGLACAEHCRISHAPLIACKPEGTFLEVAVFLYSSGGFFIKESENSVKVSLDVLYLRHSVRNLVIRLEKVKG